MNNINGERALKRVEFESGMLLSVGYFFIVGLLGLLMRSAYVIDLPEWISYKNVLHTHSHLAMMGWLFNGLYLCIVKIFELRQRFFYYIFWLLQVCIIGMTLSFPVQGYGLFSILFLSGHLILSYVFIVLVFRSLGASSLEKVYSHLLLKTALIFLFISTLGIWALGGLMQSALKGSALYYGSIQFFLHFQFNGWFTFAVLAILFRYLEGKKVKLPESDCKLFFNLLVVSCFFTFALAVTWSTPDDYIFWVNSLGVILQLLALSAFYRIIRGINKSIIENTSVWMNRLWMIAMLCFTAKIIIQSLVAIPALAVVSYTIKNFVIGFIHLLMLGGMSLFLLGIIIDIDDRVKILAQKGIALFIIGFLCSELLLFLQGILLWVQWGFLPYYYLGLVLFSALMPIGILIYFLSVYKQIKFV